MVKISTNLKSFFPTKLPERRSVATTLLVFIALIIPLDGNSQALLRPDATRRYACHCHVTVAALPPPGLAFRFSFQSACFAAHASAMRPPTESMAI